MLYLSEINNILKIKKMNVKKYYVVWIGDKGSVFDSWEPCRKHLVANEGSVCKSFPTEHEADRAALDNRMRPNIHERRESKRRARYEKPIQDSIAVDGSSSSVTGLSEYRGVYTSDADELFREGGFLDGTNNIVEFLAIVHALMFCQYHGTSIPIYSDSYTAITWVRKKAIKTTQARTENNTDLFSLVDKALEWLEENEYYNDVLKWETKSWGEIPADFNRK